MIPRYKVQLVRDGSLRAPVSQACPELAARVLREAIGDIPHEELWALLVDARSRIVGAARVGMGGFAGCAVTPADVLRAVIAHAAPGFILGHNHPSGDTSPSLDDVQFTRSIQRAAEAVGVRLLDHIIVTAGSEWRSIGGEP